MVDLQALCVSHRASLVSIMVSGSCMNVNADSCKYVQSTDPVYKQYSNCTLRRTISYNKLTVRVCVIMILLCYVCVAFKGNARAASFQGLQILTSVSFGAAIFFKVSLENTQKYCKRQYTIKLSFTNFNKPKPLEGGWFWPTLQR
eukprot:7737-Heterococcus_DN1.PRE.2